MSTDDAMARAQRLLATSKRKPAGGAAASSGSGFRPMATVGGRNFVPLDFSAASRKGGAAASVFLENTRDSREATRGGLKENAVPARNAARQALLPFWPVAIGCSYAGLLLLPELPWGPSLAALPCLLHRAGLGVLCCQAGRIDGQPRCHRRTRTCCGLGRTAGRESEKRVA